MCGRFVIDSPRSAIEKEFRARSEYAEISPRYNIAPGQQVPVAVNEEGSRIVMCTWGFIPSWTGDPGAARVMINARAETVFEKPSFRSAVRKHRCLFPASGFYEWTKRAKSRIPFYIRMKGGRLFAMAGLYSTCTYTEGQKICTCAILTTSANDLVGEIHDRMPAIIDPGNYGQWLDAGFQSREELTRMLRPYPPDNMECFEVTRKVNSPSFDFPENILPVTGGDTERFPEG